MLERLDALRTKPGHIRERIAFLTAALFTGVVAAGWFAVAASSGTFALRTNSSGQDIGAAFSQGATGVSSLLGAAAAYSNTVANPGITVETESSSTVEDVPTVLPF